MGSAIRVIDQFVELSDVSIVDVVGGAVQVYDSPSGAWKNANELNWDGANLGVGTDAPASSSGSSKVIHVSATDAAEKAGLRLESVNGSWEIQNDQSGRLRFYLNGSLKFQWVLSSMAIGNYLPDSTTVLDARPPADSWTPISAQARASQTGDLIVARDSNGDLMTGIGPSGQIKTTLTESAATVGSVTAVLPIYDETGSLVGYLPIYDTFS